jgi:hypothetical protein
VRRSPLLAKPPADRSGEPGYRAWHAPVYGCCEVCAAGPGRLERHHVIHAQHVRAIDPAREWDLANSLLLFTHCRCHRDHTSAAARLPASKIPAEALEFAVELLGQERTEDYIARYYASG